MSGSLFLWWPPGRPLGVVDPQPSAVIRQILELLRCLLGTGNVEEVGMRKASWLPGLPVDRDTHIKHILDVAEHLAKVLVAHLKRDITNVQSLGWRFRNIAAPRTHSLTLGEMNRYGAPHHLSQVHALYGFFGGLY